MKMQFLKNYLKSIEKISPQDKEYTYRAALENLFKHLQENLALNNSTLENLHIKHEPNNDKDGRGAPDFAIYYNGISIGYVENKRVDSDLDALVQSEQIAKYLSLSENILLTDYLRFCLIGIEDDKVKIIQQCRICELNELVTLANSNKSSLRSTIETKEQELLTIFDSFFKTDKSSNINTALGFANALAKRTKILNDFFVYSFDNPYIKNIYEIFKNQLLKKLQYCDFCDSFSQTLTYSLFLARLNNTSGEDITLYNVSAFIPKTFPLIRAMSKFLNDIDDIDDDNQILWLLKEILNIINHVNISNIIKELNEASEKDMFGHYTVQSTHRDPYLHFYETFLKKYDRELREIRGVYYTPVSIVYFIMNAIDSAIKKDFGLKSGFGAALDEDITLLDFATGTGTFLLEAFRKALESVPKNSPRYNPKKLLKQFFGFELLIAPYTIAHLKLSQSFKEEFNSPLGKNEKIGIYLTDTLYFKDIKQEQNDENELSETGGIPELVQETIDAQKTKENAILIITGNPPYNALSINQYDINAYKYCGIDNNKKKIPINERKHRLNDDYIKFIRFAQNKIDKQETGIVALITNNSFLDGVTMNGMRWSLLNSFNKIYLLNLHGDSNKQETCPDGSIDQNVFDIMQGVGISIFIKIKHKKELSNAPQCEVFYYDIYGDRKSKYNFLYENSLQSIPWQKLNPQFPKYEFFIQNNSLRTSYEMGKSVKEIFAKTGLGICTYRDFFCYANSKDELKNRIEKFSQQTDKQSMEKFHLSESGDWTIRAAKNELLQTKLDENLIQKVAFRPFDFRYTYYTGKSKGFLGRPAGDVQSLMLKNNIGLVCYRSCGVHGLDNIFIANTLIDLHLVGSGSNLFPLYNYSLTHNENFRLEFREFIDSKYNEHFSPKQILSYIYAVLFHKNYREKYSDFLKVDFPKIPFLESKEKFLALSALGQELIAVHLMNNSIGISPTSLPQHDNIQSIGEALFEDINNKNLQIVKISYRVKDQKLFINNSLYFSNVNSDVMEYKIGGYAVLYKYLKSHTGEEIDFKYFTKIVQALNMSLEIESRIAEIEL